MARTLQLEALPVAGMSMGALSLAQCFRLGEAERFSRYLHIDQAPVIHNRDGHEHGLLGAAQPSPHGYDVTCVARILPVACQH